MTITDRICERCSQPVSLQNDASLVLALVKDNFGEILWGKPNHLFPEGPCEGKPDWVKRITNSPIPIQKRAALFGPDEYVWRAAYDFVQEIVQKRQLTRIGSSTQFESLVQELRTRPGGDYAGL